MSTCVKDVFSY